jgi:hypothetical protein
LNGRLAQPAAWKRLATGAIEPCVLVTVALMVIGSQLVELSMKPRRPRFKGHRADVKRA